MYACVSSQKPKESLRCSGTEVVDGCKSPDVDAGN